MSFLDELRLKRSGLRAAQTTITYPDGRKYLETESGLQQLADKGCGFVVDTKPDKVPALIDSGLLLGSQDSVDSQNIQEYNITHILSVGITSPEIDTPNIIFNHLPCLDLPETDLVPIIRASCKFINEAFNSKGTVLVHCNAGVSRSAAVVIGYLINVKKLSFEDAYKLVKSKRECIQLNAGFMKQLQILK